ncbi:hypothetical protein ACNI65_09845 [Roseateles sp. So40a]|uniref:hypothetical protein n=1 Tax=Roseateles sp. So40a TaxID=3400226 RepID=UPI003A873CDA
MNPLVTLLLMQFAFRLLSQDPVDAVLFTSFSALLALPAWWTGGLKSWRGITDMARAHPLQAAMAALMLGLLIVMLAMLDNPWTRIAADLILGFFFYFSFGCLAIWALDRFKRRSGS